MHALIVAHGQPSAPAPPEAALGRLTQKIRAQLPGWSIRYGTLAMPGRVRVQARQSPPGTLVYPLFMADGWFVRTRLRRELDGLPMRFCAPLGLDPDLPACAAKILQDTAQSNGWTMADTQITLPAHGSARSNLAAEATYAFVDKLQPLLPDTQIKTGFVEQDPSIAEAAARMSSQSISLPFFAAAGGHALEDVPEALDQAGFQGVRLPPLGLAPGVPALIAAALQRGAEG